MSTFESLLAGQKLLPIIQADTIEQGIQIAKAMRDGGVRLVEVVLRTEASLAVLKAIKKEFPNMIVGAGTITCDKTLQAALEAGSDFIVTPGITASLGNELKQCKVPVLPGVSSVADILQAKEFGFNELKLFPASLSGGASFIQAMSSLFKDIIFCPTGGVNEKNKEDYLALGNCIAVGGTWVAPINWVQQKEWQKITDACKKALS